MSHANDASLNSIVALHWTAVTDTIVAVGSGVRIRNLDTACPDSELTLTVVPPGEGGLYRLTPNTLLGRALLGHRRGDIVRVMTEACTVEYEILAVAGVPDVAGSAPSVPTVRIGDIVHVRDGMLVEWWRIVPADMADARRRWMSADAPMARALLGHWAGDVVRVDRPGGRSLITILAIEPRGGTP